jgi:putative copper resistance protein D
VKLLLFAAMLGLAALNRFHLTPALALAGDQPPSFATLRLSLTIEAGAATAILALVAWLGTLEPPMSM